MEKILRIFVLMVLDTNVKDPINVLILRCGDAIKSWLVDQAALILSDNEEEFEQIKEKLEEELFVDNP